MNCIYSLFLSLHVGFSDRITLYLSYFYPRQLPFCLALATVSESLPSFPVLTHSPLLHPAFCPPCFVCSCDFNSSGPTSPGCLPWVSPLGAWVVCPQTGSLLPLCHHLSRLFLPLPRLSLSTSALHCVLFSAGPFFLPWSLFLEGKVQLAHSSVSFHSFC